METIESEMSSEEWIEHLRVHSDQLNWPRLEGSNWPRREGSSDSDSDNEEMGKELAKLEKGPESSSRFTMETMESENPVRWGLRMFGEMTEDYSADNVAKMIEFSKPHWSEVSRVEVAPQSAEEENLNRENREVLEELRKEHHSFFLRDLDALVLGRMIAKGGQAEIYEVVGHRLFLMKVFERGTSLRDLRQSCLLRVLNISAVRQYIFSAGMLANGRFAFFMERFWGDLRKLIDQSMQEKNVDGILGPPFPYQWKDYKGWTVQPVDLMLGIARHMSKLHDTNVTHRDLKASNILIRSFRVRPKNVERIVVLADFECSIGVLGTGFWRAPEILSALGKEETITNRQWKKADVYSYGMTCFEIVTGRFPFDGELVNTKADRQLVIEGGRPKLPSDLDDAMKGLITKCWAPNSDMRPTFSQIEDILETFSTKFRLFDIGDELPPYHCLATVEEVKNNPIALRSAMPGWEIANLANGSVDGYCYGMNTRLVERSDVGHKLARLQFLDTSS